MPIGRHAAIPLREVDDPRLALVGPGRPARERDRVADRGRVRRRRLGRAHRRAEAADHRPLRARAWSPSPRTRAARPATASSRSSGCAPGSPERSRSSAPGTRPPRRARPNAGAWRASAARPSASVSAGVPERTIRSPGDVEYGRSVLVRGSRLRPSSRSLGAATSTERSRSEKVSRPDRGARRGGDARPRRVRRPPARTSTATASGAPPTRSPGSAPTWPPPPPPRPRRGRPTSPTAPSHAHKGDQRQREPRAPPAEGCAWPTRTCWPTSTAPRA